MKKRILYSLLALFLIAGAALYLIPYHRLAAEKIKSGLEAMGLKIYSLTLTELDSDHAKLVDIQIGEENPLIVKSFAAVYSLLELRNKKINKLAIDGLKANIYKKDNSWQIGGLEVLTKPSTTNKPLLNFDYLKAILPAQIDIENSSLSLTQGDAVIEIPFAFNLISGAERIAGTLEAKNIRGNNLPYAVPALNLKTDYSITPETITAVTNISDASGEYLAKINFSAPTKNPRQGAVDIKQIQFPWGGGQVSVAGVHIPLDMKAPINVRLQIKNIDLAAMLAEVSEGKISGTGKVSGVLPITYYSDGHITLQKGSAKAADNGTLVMSPELLPGDNPGLVMARDALQNFHYTKLQIQLSSDHANKSLIQFSLEGKNPDANAGRPVVLNIKVAGDVIPLIQQSVLSVNNLKELIQIEGKK